MATCFKQDKQTENSVLSNQIMSKTDLDFGAESEVGSECSQDNTAINIPNTSQNFYTIDSTKNNRDTSNYLFTSSNRNNLTRNSYNNLTKIKDLLSFMSNSQSATDAPHMKSV